MLAITLGDGNGIGPELLLEAYQKEELVGDFVVVGDYSVVEYCNSKMGFGVPLTKISSLDQRKPDKLNILDEELLAFEDIQPGKISKKVAAASRAYVVTAIQLALEQKVKGIVTLPVNKEAIRLSDENFTGHTELIASMCDSENYTMMLVSDKLTVTHVNTHVSMQDAVESIKTDRVLEVIMLTQQALSRFIPEPRIAVAGLNPHAGENGAFGMEEILEINPAVAKARDQGVQAFGAIAPDTVFWRATKGEFDAVVCMYHDQGHIPIKVLDFEGGINVTLGLEVIRTSVDHGTAFDIAYQGKASTASLVLAYEYARKII